MPNPWQTDSTEMWDAEKNRLVEEQLIQSRKVQQLKSHLPLSILQQRSIHETLQTLGFQYAGIA